MTTPTLNELLRTTFTEVERSTELQVDDPAILELKNSLVRSVAELAVKREEAPQTAAGAVDLGDAPAVGDSLAPGDVRTEP